MLTVICMKRTEKWQHGVTKMKKVVLILGVLVIVVCLFLSACVPPPSEGETKVFYVDDEGQEDVSEQDLDESDEDEIVDDVDEEDVEDETEDDETEEETSDDEDADDEETSDVDDTEDEVTDESNTQTIVSEEGSVSQEDLDQLRENLESMDIEDLGGLSE